MLELESKHVADHEYKQNNKYADFAILEYIDVVIIVIVAAMLFVVISIFSNTIIVHITRSAHIVAKAEVVLSKEKL